MSAIIIMLQAEIRHKFDFVVLLIVAVLFSWHKIYVLENRVYV